MDKRIDLCCIAKNEYLTINDWVTYHLNMGFHKIWIYQNDGDDNDRMKNILSTYIDFGRVEILNDFIYAKSFQVNAYNKFIHQYYNKNLYDWIGFLDCDEYFDFNHCLYDNLSEFFCDVENKCKEISVLHVNWELYGDNGEYYYRDAPVVERFPNPIKEKVSFRFGNDENTHIKSFIKSGYDGEFTSDPHKFVTSGIVYDSDFRVTNMQSPWNFNYTYDHAKIKHYQTKSLEEYIVRKFNSGTADSCYYPYTMDYYWHRNKKTPEACDALRILVEKYKK